MPSGRAAKKNKGPKTPSKISKKLVDELNKEISPNTESPKYIFVRIIGRNKSEDELVLPSDTQEFQLNNASIYKIKLCSLYDENFKDFSNFKSSVIYPLHTTYVMSDFNAKYTTDLSFFKMEKEKTSLNLDVARSDISSRGVLLMLELIRS